MLRSSRDFFNRKGVKVEDKTWSKIHTYFIDGVVRRAKQFKSLHFTRCGKHLLQNHVRAQLKSF